nr:hypothetical protein [Tanacetum cinerariifolium]
MCKVSVQSKGITSNSYEKNTQTQTMLAVTWTEKALQVLGGNYSSTEQVNSLQQLLAYAHMIAVNNRMDSVSPPPLVAKPKKGKSQIVTSTSPKLQGPKASGALSKKRKRPTSKKPPTETKESEEDVLGAGEEMDDNPQSAETQHQSSPPQEDKHISSTAPHTEASDTDSSCDKILKKYDDTLSLTERPLVKYLRKVSRVLFERIIKDQWDKHEEAAVHYVNLKASIDD